MGCFYTKPVYEDTERPGAARTRARKEKQEAEMVPLSDAAQSLTDLQLQNKKLDDALNYTLEYMAAFKEETKKRMPDVYAAINAATNERVPDRK